MPFNIAPRCQPGIPLRCYKSHRRQCDVSWISSTDWRWYELLQKVITNDGYNKLCIAMKNHMETAGFMESIVFSDEATFQLSSKVNRHNVRIWGADNSQCDCGTCLKKFKLMCSVPCHAVRCMGYFSLRKPPLTQPESSICLYNGWWHNFKLIVLSLFCNKGQNCIISRMTRQLSISRWIGCASNNHSSSLLLDHPTLLPC